MGGLFVLQFLTIARTEGELDVGVVVERGEDVLFDRSLRVADATALAALLAAGREGGFEVETREYPGQGTYVARVGAHRETGAEGWLYCVGDPCAHPRLAPDRYALRDGDRLRWHWGTADDGLL